MKLQLNKIAEIVTYITGISLMQMRSGLRFPEFVEARHLFLNIASEYGDYSRKKELTTFINQKDASSAYAIKVKYKISNLIKLAKKQIADISSNNFIYINTLIENLNTDDKISIINTMYEDLPPHKRQLINSH